VRSLAAAALSLLFLAVEAAPMVGAVTYAGDIAALVQVRSTLNSFHANSELLISCYVDLSNLL
jgi:hypothetical protein